MNVLIITQYYPPETGALASRWGDFSQIMSKEKHEVTVLCESPHYPNDSYYVGFKNSFLNIKTEGKSLNVFRTKAFASNRKTTLKKMIHYLVFMTSAILNIKKIKNYDHLIISSPPLFTGIIGVYVKKMLGKDYWLDVRDLWPDSALELNQISKGIFYNLGKFLEKKIYKNAKGFIFPVPSFRQYLSEFPSEISEKPMFDLMNGVSEKFIKEASKVDTIQNARFTVLYSGNLGLAQDFKTIISSAAILEDYDIYFKFIGDGVCKSELYDLAKPLGEKISFQKSIPRMELIKCIKKSSVCLVPLKDKKIFRSALPSKMFEYMACSKPVIVGVYGDARKIIETSKSGTSVEPENPEMLSKAILSYYNNQKKITEHGKNGLSYVTRNLKKEVLISNLINEIEKRI